MTDMLELSARAAAGAIAAGSLSSEELFEAYRARAAADRAAGGDGLNCFTWVAERAPGGDAPMPLHGVPLARRVRKLDSGLASWAKLGQASVACRASSGYLRR
jgi:Asp-tRNA(Asn)/Glu-tRNA(Gln) amidotransferase A subunit family amidase